MAPNDLRRTPLNGWHREHGARMVEFGGWDMPVQYESGILAEHQATRRSGGLFDVSHMGRFRFRGADTIPFLQHVLSNNAEALEPWQAQYTLIPNERGGVVDDAYLYRFGDDDYLLVVNASNATKDWEHLQALARQFTDLSIRDDTEGVSMIAFQGPLATTVLESLVESGSLPKPFRNALSRVTIADVELLIGRTGYTGEPVCFELFVPAGKAVDVWTALAEAGRQAGVVSVGLGARDTLRLEAGLPLYGHEFGTDPDGKEIPALAVPLTEVAVSLSPRKGDFVGRAALANQLEEVRRLRTGAPARSDALPARVHPVALTDQGVARQGDPVFVGSTRVGVVTSGTVAPHWVFTGDGASREITDESRRRAIGLALVDASLPPEQDVEVDVRGRRLHASLVKCHGFSDAPPYFRPAPVTWPAPQHEPAVGAGLVKARHLLRRALDNHEWRQRQCVNLIPSEMTPSPLVRLLQVSDPVARYAEHREFPAFLDQEVFYYQGTDFIAWVEDRLVAELAAFLGCEQVETRPVSGQMANMTVFSALVDWRNRANRRAEPGRIRLAMTNHIGYGGHLSAQPMGALRDYIAKDPVTERFAVVNFPVRDDDPYRIDVEAAAGIIERTRPELIVFGKSMVIYREPLAEIAAIVAGWPDRPIVMYDMAHVLGLVGPHFQAPFAEGAEVVTGSTHKTFFGTQRGIVAMNAPENTSAFDLWKAVRRRAFPGMTSNHHLGTLLGLLLAAIEMNAFKDAYQSQVIANAKAFAVALRNAGLDVAGDPSLGFTETHQVLVRVGDGRGVDIARRLERSNIIVNYQALPGDQSFTASSGLRLGVAEMTRFGMREADFRAFAPLFADAVGGSEVGDAVAAFRQGFQTIGYCFDGPELALATADLLATF